MWYRRRSSGRQLKVQVELKKGSPVGTDMGSGPGHRHTSLCCRYRNVQFKHQPGHTAADSTRIHQAAETSECWRNRAESTSVWRHTGAPVTADGSTETLFIRSHMPARSHTKFSWSAPPPEVSAVVSLFAQKHSLNLHSALWNVNVPDGSQMMCLFDFF